MRKARNDVAASGTEPEDGAAAGGEADYEWAEFNLPMMPPLRRGVAAEEANDALDFMGLGIDPDAPLPGNS
jgi:hypothetical protein